MVSNAYLLEFERKFMKTFPNVYSVKKYHVTKSGRTHFQSRCLTKVKRSRSETSLHSAKFSTGKFFRFQKYQCWQKRWKAALLQHCDSTMRMIFAWLRSPFHHSHLAPEEGMSRTSSVRLLDNVCRKNRIWRTQSTWKSCFVFCCSIKYSSLDQCPPFARQRSWSEVIWKQLSFGKCTTIISRNGDFFWHELDQHTINILLKGSSFNSLFLSFGKQLHNVGKSSKVFVVNELQLTPLFVPSLFLWCLKEKSVGAQSSRNDTKVKQIQRTQSYVVKRSCVKN